MIYTVASFYAPRFSAWGGCDYDELLRTVDASCQRLGFPHFCISDAKRPTVPTFLTPDLPRNLMQAFLEGQARFMEKTAGPILLTGADCVLTRPPGDVFGDDYDIAITLGPFADCPMNTGAIFIKDGAKCAPVWRNALLRHPVEWGEDQTCLYAAILTAKANGTLRVRELDCREWNWAPANAQDRCGLPVIAHFRGPRKGWMAQWYDIYVVRGLPELKYTEGANVETTAMLDNMRAAAKRDLPWFTGAPEHGGTLAIVGGAPSLKTSLPDIRIRQRLHKAQVWACNNAWRPLVAAGIQPDVIAMMDARAENAAFVEGGPDCRYLVAAMCHPDVFDALAGRKVTVWWPDQAIGEREIVDGYDKPAVLVGGGGTIGMRCMPLAHVAGFRELHLYGVDSSYSGADHHAYAQPLNDGEKLLSITALGREYVCAGWMARQANEFQSMRATLAQAGTRVWAHGSGLIPDISRHLNKADAKKGKPNGRGHAHLQGGRGQDAHRAAVVG